MTQTLSQGHDLPGLLLRRAPHLLQYGSEIALSGEQKRIEGLDPTRLVVLWRWLLHALFLSCFFSLKRLSFSCMAYRQDPGCLPQPALTKAGAGMTIKRSF